MPARFYIGMNSSFMYVHMYMCMYMYMCACVYVCLCALSRAVQRSRVHVWTAKQRKKETKQYCIFYNRFGQLETGLVS